MRLGLDGAPQDLGPDVARCLTLLGACSPRAVVAVASGDERALAVLSLAVVRSGRTLLPLDPRAPAPEVAAALALAEIAFLDPGLAERWARGGRTVRIEPPPPESLLSRMLGRPRAPVSTFPGVLRDLAPSPDPPADPDSVAILLRTSGTTGGPKLVPWTRAALAAQLDILTAALGVGAGSRVLNLLPAFHIDGLIMGALMCERAGAALLRLPREQVLDVRAAADLVYRERCSHLIAVPALLGVLLRLGEDLRPIFGEAGFSAFVSTAAPLPDPIWRRLEQASGRPVINVYGLTETGNLFFAGPGAETRVVGTVGRGVGCEVKLAGGGPGEPGELLLRGPTVVRAFQDGSPAVDAEGWFPTGDLVRIGEDGLLRVLGRVRGLLSVGGLKVAPIEVEQALLELPGVRDARVFGEPDPVWGERVVAELVGEGLDPGALTAALRERLSEHKIPRELRILGQIRRGATGKAPAAGAAADPTEERLLRVAAGVFRVPVDELNLASRMGQVPGWDSIGHLDLIAALESAFGLSLGLHEIMQIRSLADALRVVGARGLG